MSKSKDKSLFEKDTWQIVEDIYKQSSIHGCNIITPSDFAVSDKLNGKAVNKDRNNILENEIINPNFTIIPLTFYLEVFSRTTGRGKDDIIITENLILVKHL